MRLCKGDGYSWNLHVYFFLYLGQKRIDTQTHWSKSRGLN